MSTEPTLRPSVISSSSSLPLDQFAARLARMPADVTCDVFLLREIDLEAIADVWGEPIPSNQSLAAILSLPLIETPLLHWIASSLEVLKDRRKYPVSALATYIPAVTSCSFDRKGGSDRAERETAIAALTNCVKLACLLCEEELMRQPIIEIVCGSVLDSCDCDECTVVQERNRRRDNLDGHMLLVGNREQKLKVLLNAISDVKERLKEFALEKPGGVRSQWVVAVELEPGETYVLNSQWTLLRLNTLLTLPAHKEISSHVGFNVDIAHYLDAGVEMKYIDAIKARIVHSHICDNPGMHTRDLPVGHWWSGDGKDMLSSYVDMLAKAARDRTSQSEPLPFSGRVALELEGCSRESWMWDGVDRLNVLLQRMV